MEKSFRKWLVGIAATLLFLFVATNLVWFGLATEDYDSVCTRCLERARCVDKSFYGVRYSHSEKAVPKNEPLYISRGGGSVSVDPDTFIKIFDHPCSHHFIRYGGFGRERAGVIADGEISQPPPLDVRLALIGRLFEAYGRIPDRALAIKTYSIIDRDYPENLDWDTEFPMPSVLLADATPNEPASILYRGLPKVSSLRDWSAVLDDAKAGNGKFRYSEHPKFR